MSFPALLVLIVALPFNKKANRRRSQTCGFIIISSGDTVHFSLSLSLSLFLSLSHSWRNKISVLAGSHMSFSLERAMASFHFFMCAGTESSVTRVGDF